MAAREITIGRDDGCGVDRQRAGRLNRLEVASAYTLVFFVMIIPLLIAMQFFAGYRSNAMGPGR